MFVVLALPLIEVAWPNNADSNDDVSAVPGFLPPPNGRVLVKPEVVVTRELTL